MYHDAVVDASIGEMVMAVCRVRWCGVVCVLRLRIVANRQVRYEGPFVQTLQHLTTKRASEREAGEEKMVRLAKAFRASGLAA